MVASNTIIKSGSAQKINFFCLIAAIIIILVLPLKKEIWYDETISILCSKGISHDAPAQFSNVNTISSTTLEQLNNSGAVFNATVTDNANGFLYNMGLHWFTLLSGNSISAYMMLSKLCGIMTLVAFFALCTLLFGKKLFTSVAILLLAMDNNFIGLSHEIRDYSMGICFVTLAAVYFYKFMYRQERPLYLFLTGLFSVGAILSHFLSVYIVLVFLGALLFTKRTALFSLRNIVAILLPLALLGLFFYYAYPGLHVMSVQNQQIHDRSASQGFSIGEVFLRAIKFTAIDFKIVFPAFADKVIVSFLSFLLFLALYIAGTKAATNNADRSRLHLLCILGASSSAFLAILSIRSQHYTALYYRYFSFCIPFCCLFTAHLFYVFFTQPKSGMIVKSVLPVIIIVPVCALFLSGIMKSKAVVRYNHVQIASEIVSGNIVKIGVPAWDDAFLIQCFLPQGYKIDYFRDPDASHFTLYRSTGEEKVPVIKSNS